MNQPNDSDIFRRTLRMVGILVGACVLFVGALSASAVAITSKAMGTAHDGATDTSSSSTDSPSVPNKPGPSRPTETKKPGSQSI